MSFKVNLRHLEEDGIHMEGELPVEELDLGLQDEMMAAKKPLQYDLEVEEITNGILVQGKLSLTLDCQCVRCLKSFKRTIELPNWTLHLPLEGDEKTPVDNDCIDLTPFAREDMLLEFPRHPLCRQDCDGLKKNGHVGSETSPAAWNELNKLDL
jgi:uncharacterized metal-binding protein YceD (DUF177 family)